MPRAIDNRGLSLTIEEESLQPSIDRTNVSKHPANTIDNIFLIFLKSQQLYGSGRMHLKSVAKRVKAEIEDVENFSDLKIIKPKVFPDERGYFVERFNTTEWAEQLKFNEEFKQDNHSFSVKGVVRGIHSQPGMGKLVSVITGEIFDVAVDLRRDSPTYGQWHGVILNGTNNYSFWIPDGFGHGFQVCLWKSSRSPQLLTTSLANEWLKCISPEGAQVVYKCTAVYDPNSEFGIDPFDRDIKVEWPLTEGVIVSERDKCHQSFEKYSITKQ